MIKRWFPLAQTCGQYKDLSARNHLKSSVLCTSSYMKTSGRDHVWFLQKKIMTVSNKLVLILKLVLWVRNYCAPKVVFNKENEIISKNWEQKKRYFTIKYSDLQEVLNNRLRWWFAAGPITWKSAGSKPTLFWIFAGGMKSLLKKKKK